jgi:hypothetical protein
MDDDELRSQTLRQRSFLLSFLTRRKTAGADVCAFLLFQNAD